MKEAIITAKSSGDRGISTVSIKKVTEVHMISLSKLTYPLTSVF